MPSRLGGSSSLLLGQRFGCKWRCDDYLVDKILAVIVAQFLSSDNAMQVGLHQLLHEVYVFEQCETVRLKDVENGDDVFVAKVPEKLDLAKGA